jgi:hypothetical protein
LQAARVLSVLRAASLRLAASFISSKECDVAFWHFASFRCAAKLVADWTTTDKGQRWG